MVTDQWKADRYKTLINEREGPVYRYNGWSFREYLRRKGRLIGVYTKEYSNDVKYISLDDVTGVPLVLRKP